MILIPKHLYHFKKRLLGCESLPKAISPSQVSLVCSKNQNSLSELWFKGRDKIYPLTWPRYYSLNISYVQEAWPLNLLS